MSKGNAWTSAIAEIAGDRVHGASWIARRGASILQGLTGAELRAAARAVATAQPSMASLFNLANGVLIRGSAPEALVAELDRTMSSVVARGAAFVMGLEAVLTHSRSGTVERILLQARPRVICTESQPQGEGIALAAALHAAGVTVSCVPDGDVERHIGECAAIVTGADAVSAAVLVNKAGTARIASLARRPFYAACTLDKFLPRVRAAGELFDETPLELVTAVITERGPMTPREVRLHVESLQIHPDLRDLL